VVAGTCFILPAFLIVSTIAWVYTRFGQLPRVGHVLYGVKPVISLGDIFLFFVKVGSVPYGSGYVLLAFLRADLVEHWGWLTEAQLLDAVAVGQVTPGPVFTSLLLRRGSRAAGGLSSNARLRGSGRASCLSNYSSFYSEESGFGRVSHGTSTTPDAPTSRIESLDILRGAALLGIFIVHGTQVFCGWFSLSAEQQAALPHPFLNGLTQVAVTFLLKDKARVLFAFLFGVSFSLQLRSAEKQNDPIHRLFLRRMAILLLFGLVHAHLLFGADILRYYALSGLLLLAAWQWSTRRLLLTGAVLTVLVPCAADLLTQVLETGTSLPDGRTIIAAYQSSSPITFLWIENLMALERYRWPFLLNYAAPTAGTLLFGMWVGRHGFLQRAEQHRTQLRTWAWWGLGLGLFGQLLVLGAEAMMERWSLPVKMGLFLVFMPLVYVGYQALALCYICALSLLCTRPAWRRRLSVLAPAGQMTLTNYFLQSLLGALLFSGWGLGLYGQVGPFVVLLLTLAVCVLQLVTSTWWLRHFHMGPLEWLWRLLLRKQQYPFKRVPDMSRSAGVPDPGLPN
jgi:uncharacterized protein